MTMQLQNGQEVKEDELVSVEWVANELGISKADLIKHYQEGDLPIKMHFDHKGKGYFKELEFADFVLNEDNNLEEWTDAIISKPSEN